ncbi:MAG: YihY/virulence factor BrkB family protein [Pyrinomonadaceae bacterium]
MKHPTLLWRHKLGVRNRAPWLTMIGHALHRFHENDLFTPAAAMSYFGLLALFPALLVLLVLSNQFAAVTDILTRTIAVYPGSGDFLRTTIRSLGNVGTATIISCVIVTLWAGSWVFAVVERAVNRIWGTRPRTFLHGRALTIGMLGVVGLVLSGSAFVTSIIVALRQLASRIPLRRLEAIPVLAATASAFWQGVFALISLLVTVALFTLVYRFMPSGRVTLRDTLPGAIIAGVLWEAAKYIFAASLHYFHYDQIYGSVGAVVAVLTWSYVSSLILMFGAQLSAVFHEEHPPADAHDGAEDLPAAMIVRTS